MSAKRLAAGVALASAIALAGCESPTLIVIENPLTLFEERSLSDAHEDARVLLDIRSLFAEHDPGKFKNVTVEVYEGAVMLTGTVIEQTDRTRAAALAGTVGGADPVYNELLVLEDASLEEAAADLALETKIKKVLRAADGIHSVNMRWHSVNGTVFLFGRALSKEERDLTLKTVRKIRGVEEVVDRLKIVPLAD